MKTKFEKLIFALSDTREGGSAAQCVNLHLKEEGGREVVCPTGEPAIAAEGDWTVFHEHVDEEGAQMWISSEAFAGGLRRVATLKAGEAPAVAGAVSGEVLTALSLSSRRAIVCTTADRYEFRKDGGRWGLIGAAATATARLTARVKFSFTASTGAMTLKGVGSRDTTLSTANRRAVGERLTAGYNAVAAEAASAGMWIQPMVVWQRLVDGAGNTIGESGATLLSAGGWQMTGAATARTTARSDDSIDVDDLRIDGDAYVIDAEVPTESGEAQWIEIMSAGQMHPAAGEDAACRLTTRNGERILSAAIPGMTNNFASRATELAEKVKRIAAGGADSAKCIARIDIGKHRGDIITITASADDLGDNIEKIEARARKNRAANVSGSGVMGRIGSGARWTAGSAAAGGGSVVYADIRVGEPESSILRVATGGGNGEKTELTIAVKVTMSDGTERVRHFTETGTLPEHVQPLISYPDRRATGWELTVEDETGNRRRATATLTAVTGGIEMSSYLNPTLEPIMLTATDDELPAETTPTSERMPGMLLLSSIENPLKPTGSTICGTETVTCLSNAARVKSAWEASRDRYIIAATDGIYAATCRGSNGDCRIAKLHTASACRRGAIASTPAGIAVGCGKRLMLAGSSTATTIDRFDEDIMSIAWHDGMRELLAVDASGNLSIRKLTAQGAVRFRSAMLLPVAPRRLTATSDGGVWASSDNGLLHYPSVPDEPELTDIEWQGEVTSRSGRRPQLLYLGIAGSRVEGLEIELKSHGGAGAGYGRRIVKARMNGEVNMPLTLRTVSPPANRYSLRIAGKVAGDFRLTDAGIAE